MFTFVARRIGQLRAVREQPPRSNVVNYLVYILCSRRNGAHRSLAGQWLGTLMQPMLGSSIGPDIQEIRIGGPASFIFLWKRK